MLHGFFAPHSYHKITNKRKKEKTDLHSIMLSRVASTFIRKTPTSTRFAKQVSAPMGTRFYSLEDSPSAKSAWEKSCYFEMDFTIPEDASVFEAVQKFAVSSSCSYYFMIIK